MISLPPLGMGTAGIGNLYAPVSADDARATVTAAWAAGIRYFDTAPQYGFGLAERRLGEALAALDPEGRAIISTKVGRLLAPAPDGARERLGPGVEVIRARAVPLEGIHAVGERVEVNRDERVGVGPARNDGPISERHGPRCRARHHDRRSALLEIHLQAFGNA